MIHTGLQLASLLAALDSHADPRLWFVTRGAAVAAYLLLAVSVALGLLRSLARALAVRASWVLDELHAYTALLAAAFLALHLISLVLDPLVPFPVITLLLPFGEPYRAFASALGVFALYSFAAVLLSSWLRRRLTYRFWRRLHYASFAAFALATLHGVLAGADTAQPWMRAVYVGATAALVFLFAVRLLLSLRVLQVTPERAGAPVRGDGVMSEPTGPVPGQPLR
jgi:sulfoxide reductase heme-binding subunit YedZ